MTSPADVLEGRARWCVQLGDCRDLLRALPDKSVDHIISDPPYSAQVHSNVRSAKRDGLPDVADHACRVRRTVDLGFESLTHAVRRAVAGEAARTVKRWSMFFSDVESCHLWRFSCEAAGLRYVRTCEWRRIGGAPQFTGDRPASGFETITVAHAANAGRFRWNGGGKAGSYEYPIVANRAGQRFSRIHPTQKPLELMLDLVADFTLPDEIVCDPFCGSATTGLACLRLGRRFIGFELDVVHAETARVRLDAEVRGSTIQAASAGQGALFG